MEGRKLERSHVMFRTRATRFPNQPGATFRQPQAEHRRSTVTPPADTLLHLHRFHNANTVESGGIYLLVYTDTTLGGRIKTRILMHFKTNILSKRSIILVTQKQVNLLVRKSSLSAKLAPTGSGPPSSNISRCNLAHINSLSLISKSHHLHATYQLTLSPSPFSSKSPQPPHRSATHTSRSRPFQT
jgi:hypothetical protein